MVAHAEPDLKQKSAVQKKDAKPMVLTPNRTGIPDTMKSRFENLSGFSFDDVRVHYNSDKPAQLQALAYTQGNQVYVGPGQEKHLRHELGHVVQQKQGRVQPTVQLQGVGVNNDPALEREADGIDNHFFSVYAATNNVKASLPNIVQKKTEIKYEYTMFKYDSLLAQERVGKKMFAILDPMDFRAGSEPGSSEQKDLMTAFTHEFGRQKFVRGHLLNHDLGGLGVKENLFPITSAANADHKARVELPVKEGLRRLWDVKNKNSFNADTIEYRVEADSSFSLYDSSGSSAGTDKFKCQILFPASISPSTPNYKIDIQSVRPPGARPQAPSAAFAQEFPYSRITLDDWEHDGRGVRSDIKQSEDLSGNGEYYNQPPWPSAKISYGTYKKV